MSKTKFFKFLPTYTHYPQMTNPLPNFWLLAFLTQKSYLKLKGDQNEIYLDDFIFADDGCDWDGVCFYRCFGLFLSKASSD